MTSPHPLTRKGDRVTKQSLCFFHPRSVPSPSLPVVQLVVRIDQRDTGFVQIAYGSSNVSCRHVVPRVAVVANDQDALVMAVRGQEDENVQVLKIEIVPRPNCTVAADSLGKVNLVAASGQADVGGYLDVVAIMMRKPDESRIDAVVVDIQPHSPSLTRSSVERARGLPLRLMAG